MKINRINVEIPLLKSSLTVEKDLGRVAHELHLPKRTSGADV